MDKSTEQDREEKARGKLAVLPFMRPNENTSSPANPPIPLDASNELDAAPVDKLLADTAEPSEPNGSCESEQVDDSNLPARTPRLPVVGPTQLESRQQDRLQAITDYDDRELEPQSLVPSNHHVFVRLGSELYHSLVDPDPVSGVFDSQFRN